MHSSVRRIANAPIVSLTVILTLALGTGAGTTIFSLLNAVLIRQLPYRNSERLVQVWETVQGKGAAGSRTFCSGSAFVHWRDHAEVFETVGFLNPISANFTGSQDPERIKGYLETLGVKALVGQIFDISEYKMGGARNDVMLSYSLWVDHFSSDPKIVGRTISIDNVSRSIIGILPKDALMVSI